MRCDSFVFIGICLALDVILGDPPYRLHPVRVTGMLLTACERALRGIGWDGRLGGITLFLMLVASVGGGAWGVHAALEAAARPLAWAWNVYLGYSFLALGDLVAHGRRIARRAADGDLPGAREATAMLVGRDTNRMDFPACNRAAVESIAESLVDGVLAPLFWLAAGGLPGLILFKIASTMDSMVGYRNERYMRFGWFGARLDDVMNWIPARLGFLLIALFSLAAPGFSGRKAWRVGLGQHSLLPGPNKGWSETAAAGALQVRLAGPIHKGGALVNELWIGAPGDREGGSAGDVARMIRLAYGVTLMFLVLILGAYRLAGPCPPWRWSW